MTTEISRETMQDVIREITRSPVLAGLFALALNQLAYKAHLWDPRPSQDGQYRAWRSNWGIDADGVHLGDRTYEIVDPEQVASDNATLIGMFIIAASTAAAAKAPVVQAVNVR